MEASGTQVSGLEPSGPAVVPPARPEPIRIEPSKTALVVVDMQNAYASPGGYLDIAGFDIAGAAAATERVVAAVEAARGGAGIPVIFLQSGWKAGYMEAGGPGSLNWHKSNAPKAMRGRPELAGKLLAKGGWDYALVDALTPRPGDIVIPKPRYSVFFNTGIDSVLRARHPQPGVHRRRDERLCRVVAARRLPPRILRRRAGGRHAPGRAGVRASCGALQHREVLRLGFHRGRFLRRHPPDAALRAAGTVPMPMKPIIPAGSGKPLAPYSPGALPARYCVQCGLVKPDALVEIATTAHIGTPA